MQAEVSDVEEAKDVNSSNDSAHSDNHITGYSEGSLQMKPEENDYEDEDDSNKFAVIHSISNTSGSGKRFSQMNTEENDIEEQDEYDVGDQDYIDGDNHIDKSGVADDDSICDTNRLGESCEESSISDESESEPEYRKYQLLVLSL